MQIDTYPVYKKAYTRWYDATAVCLLTLLFLFSVCGFSVVGIGLALETPGFEGHVGLPVTLLLLCVPVILSISVRLFLRMLRRSGRR
jgi:hypothetical protein